MGLGDVTEGEVSKVFVGIEVVVVVQGAGGDGTEAGDGGGGAGGAGARARGVDEAGLDSGAEGDGVGEGEDMGRGGGRDGSEGGEFEVELGSRALALARGVGSQLRELGVLGVEAVFRAVECDQEQELLFDGEGGGRGLRGQDELGGSEFDATGPLDDV